MVGGGNGGDGGIATAAFLNGPFGMTISSNGDIYIADTNNNRIRKARKEEKWFFSLPSFIQML